MRNLREKQLKKFYKSLNRQALARYVWSMSYDYDYTTKLDEYGENERHTEYASNHAHDYASEWNNLDDFLSRSACELWDDYKNIYILWSKYESEVL